MTSPAILEKRLRRAEFALREQLPGVGLLLIGVLPNGENGFALQQVANMPTASVRATLVAALEDIDAGLGQETELDQL